MDQRQQIQLFDRAMKLFREGDFSAARRVFEEVADGPATDLAHSGRMYARMCDRRQATAETIPQSPAELYSAAVTLMNRGDYSRANLLLVRAVASGQTDARTYFAVALCSAMAGDIAEAAVNLSQAVERNPALAGEAWADLEFRLLIQQHPALAAIAGPERSASV